MVLNVSGRCDIVAFYTEWFMNRYKDGYVGGKKATNWAFYFQMNSTQTVIIFIGKHKCTSEGFLTLQISQYYHL